MQPEVRDALRNMLLDSYKPRKANDVFCARCSNGSLPVSFHLIQFSADGPVNPPLGCVPMSSRRYDEKEAWSGSFPICTYCAPVCKNCTLPIPSERMLDFLAKLKLEPFGTGVSLGQGFCQHMRLNGLVVAIFKRCFGLGRFSATTGRTTALSEAGTPPMKNHNGVVNEGERTKSDNVASPKLQSPPVTRAYINNQIAHINGLRNKGNLHEALSECETLLCLLDKQSADNAAALREFDALGLSAVKELAEAGNPEAQSRSATFCYRTKASSFIRGLRPFDYARAFALLLLFIAFCSSDDSGYFILLRWIVCPVLAMAAYRAHRAQRVAWTWIYGVDAAIFNPLVLSRLGDVWVFVDFITASLIITSFFMAFGRAPKVD